MNRNKIVFSICAIIFAIVFFEIIIYINNGIKISELNNMYKDIKNLEDKIALYYLDNGSIPIKDESIIYFSDNSINPNDNEIYYEIDISKLENLDISYGKGVFGAKDKYIINEESHTIYYYLGIEYKDKMIFSRDINYEYVDLENY